MFASVHTPPANHESALDDFFATTPGFGQQIDIAFKIVPHALFVYLRKNRFNGPSYQDRLSVPDRFERPFVGFILVRRSLTVFV